MADFVLNGLVLANQMNPVRVDFLLFSKSQTCQPPLQPPFLRHRRD
jgi:hypothetical protein